MEWNKKLKKNRENLKIKNKRIKICKNQLKYYKME